MTSLAQPSSRELRGLKLYEEHGHLIEKVAPDFYLVPSQDGEHFYHVDYRDEVCDCPDHEHRHVTCLHIYAVGISRAKRRAKTRPCVECGGRFVRRDLVEVQESSLYGEGELLCRECWGASDALAL